MYIDLEIRILKREKQGYPVELTVDKAQQFQGGYLDPDFLPWIPSASAIDAGQRLFNWLFSDAHLLRAWGQIRGQKATRRVRLRIDATAPELHPLPWELLRDTSPGLTPQFLAADAVTPFSRYLAGEWEPGHPVAERPIKMLVAIANPDGLEAYGLVGLDVNREKESLQQALAGVDSPQLEIMFLADTVSLPRLAAKLKKNVHILHLIAHGAFSQRKGTASLYLADDDNDMRLIKAGEFAEMLGRLHHPPQLVFLSSCETATRSPADAFRGFAPSLVMAGVPAVLAMQDLVPIQTAQQFARTFYQQLLEHGQVDLASNQARAALMNAALPGSSIPVLFSRLPDNLLFATATEEGTQADYPPPPEPTRPPELGQFIGRETELNDYAAKLKNDHLAVISGMPGVGKTALAITLAEIWQVWQMSEARSTDLESLEAITESQTPPRNKVFWYTFQEDEGIMALVWQLAGFIAWNGQQDLWRMLQVAQQSGSQPPPATALFDYVLKLVRGQGYLLCLDDVHYVRQDPQLIQFIDRLRELVQAGEVSFILTSRVVPDYIRTATFEPLQGLSAADVSRIVASQGISLSDDRIEALHALTEGNAEIVTLAANVLRRANDPAKVIERVTEVDHIERYLIKEVDDGLSGHDRQVMIAVAILLGYPGSRDAIETISDRTRLKRILRGLSDLHLLTQHQGDIGELYGAHAIIRAFYYDVPSRRERRLMHQLAAQYYQGEEGDQFKAALHFERANDYQQAAELITTDVWRLINQGQAQPARNLLQRLESHPLDFPVRINLALALGQIDGYLGESQAARERYETVLFQLAQQPETPHVRLQKARTYRALGELLVWEDPQEALGWLQQGLELVRGSNEFEEAASNIVGGTAHMFLWNYSQALKMLELGLAHLPEGDSQLRVTALENLGVIYFERGDVEPGLAITLQALEMSQRLQDHFKTIEILNTLASYKFDIGAWSETISLFDQALRLADRLGSEKAMAHVEMNLGYACIFLDDDETTLEHLTNGVNLARKTNQRLLESDFQLNMAELRVRQQAWQAADLEMSKAERLTRELDVKKNWPAIYRGWAEIKRATGQLEDALNYAEQAVNYLQNSEEDLELGKSLRTLAQVLEANGQRQPALETFAKSLSLLEPINLYEAARTKAAWGLVLISDPVSIEALALIETAQVTFKRLGARRDLMALETDLSS